MQETARRKPVFAISVTAAVVVVLLAAVFIIYGIFRSSYGQSLTKLQSMVAEAQQQYEKGVTTSGATLGDQYAMYSGLGAKVTGLQDILAKLNARYTVLPGRATEEDLGLNALSEGLKAMEPALATLKKCMDDDAAIAAELQSLLAGGDKQGISADYTDLLARNTALGAKLATLKFTGALETGRAALDQSITARGRALTYLQGDAAVGEELAADLSDTKTLPSDLKPRLESLLERNNKLPDTAAGVDLQSYGAGAGGVAQRIEDRAAIIQAAAAYMGELSSLQQPVADFCAGLGQGAAAGGKLSDQVASYMTWVSQVQGLEKQLDGINGKKDYEAVLPKRDLTSLGMSAAGRTLTGYAAAISAVNAGLGTSKAIEKQIDSILANGKLSLDDKVGALTEQSIKNDELTASLAVEVPEGMQQGLMNFTAACKERVVFFRECIGWVQDKAAADTFMGTYQYYMNLRKEYLATAKDYLAVDGKRSDNVIYYEDLADDQVALAQDQMTQYNAAIKSANAHKKASDASRKKVQAMLGQ